MKLFNFSTYSCISFLSNIYRMYDMKHLKMSVTCRYILLKEFLWGINTFWHPHLMHRLRSYFVMQLITQILVFGRRQISRIHMYLIKDIWIGSCCFPFTWFFFIFIIWSRTLYYYQTVIVFLVRVFFWDMPRQSMVLYT